VAIADALVGQGYVEIDDESGVITDAGTKFFLRVGILLPDSEMSSRRTTRPLCRPCLDWSERRPHLAGRLGAALCTHAFKAGWLRRINGTRAVVTTPKGLMAMKQIFGIAQVP